MSFWSGQKLADRAKKEELISPFCSENIEGSAYELAVGGEAFVTRDADTQNSEIGAGKAPGHLVLNDAECFCIPPGQFSLLITEEIVSMPLDALGLLSIKASKKWSGLVNVSGFHVDPGWRGRLVFGVFNAGPQHIFIRSGDKFFLLFFAELESSTDEEYSYDGDYKFETIPTRFMQKLSATVPTVYQHSRQIGDLREDIKGAINRSNIAMTIAVTTIALIGLCLGILRFVGFSDMNLKDVEPQSISKSAGTDIGLDENSSQVIVVPEELATEEAGLQPTDSEIEGSIRPPGDR